MVDIDTYPNVGSDDMNQLPASLGLICFCLDWWVQSEVRYRDISPPSELTLTSEASAAPSGPSPGLAYSPDNIQNPNPDNGSKNGDNLKVAQKYHFV